MRHRRRRSSKRYDFQQQRLQRYQTLLVAGSVAAVCIEKGAMCARRVESGAPVVASGVPVVATRACGMCTSSQASVSVGDLGGSSSAATAAETAKGQLAHVTRPARDMCSEGTMIACVRTGLVRSHRYIALSFDCYRRKAPRTLRSGARKHHVFWCLRFGGPALVQHGCHLVVKVVCPYLLSLIVVQWCANALALSGQRHANRHLDARADDQHQGRGM